MSNPASARNAPRTLTDIADAIRDGSLPWLYPEVRDGEYLNAIRDDLYRLATERAIGGLDVRKVRAVLVDVMLNDRPEDTVYSVADRIIARLAAPQPGEPSHE